MSSSNSLFGQFLETGPKGGLASWNAGISLVFHDGLKDIGLLEWLFSFFLIVCSSWVISPGRGQRPLLLQGFGTWIDEGTLASLRASGRAGVWIRSRPACIIAQAYLLYSGFQIRLQGSPPSDSPGSVCLKANLQPFPDILTHSLWVAVLGICTFILNASRWIPCTITYKNSWSTLDCIWGWSDAQGLKNEDTLAPPVWFRGWGVSWHRLAWDLLLQHSFHECFGKPQS